MAFKNMLLTSLLAIGASAAAYPGGRPAPGVSKRQTPWAPLNCINLEGFTQCIGNLPAGAGCFVPYPPMATMW